MTVVSEALRRHRAAGRHAPAATETADPATGRVGGLTERLRRVEGQMRVIQRMVCERQYCLDVLTELAEARASLREVERALLHAQLESARADAAGRLPLKPQPRVENRR